MAQIVGTEDLPRGEYVVDKLGRRLKVWDGDDRPPAPLNWAVPCCWALKTDKSGDRCEKIPFFNGVRYTRCKVHGGASTGPKLTTGQGSKLAGRRIAEMARELENDQGLTSIEEQVKLAAAVLGEYMRKLEVDEVEDLTPKEIDALLKRIENVTKLIERRHKIREGQLYTVRSEHVIVVIQAVSEAINAELADYPELRTNLARRIGRLKIVETEPKKQLAAAAAENG